MASNMAMNGPSGASCEVTNATPIEQERMSIMAWIVLGLIARFDGISSGG